MKKAILMNKDDNVATVLKSVKKGEMIAVISTDNKVIKNKEAVVKYGESIGTATDRIDQGTHVHIHNVCSKVKYDGS